jgi:hypothetical protein
MHDGMQGAERMAIMLIRGRLIRVCTTKGNNTRRRHKAPTMTHKAIEACRPQCTVVMRLQIDPLGTRATKACSNKHGYSCQTTKRRDGLSIVPALQDLRYGRASH